MPLAGAGLVAVMAVHSFHFLLSAFPDDHQHEKFSPLGTRRHVLECPFWMRQRLSGVGGECQYPASAVFAVCKGEVAAKDVWSGPLTLMSPEQSVLYRFWHFPTDCLFVRISMVKAFNFFAIPESICSPHVRCDDNVWRPNPRRPEYVKPSPTTEPFKPWLQLLPPRDLCDILQDVGLRFEDLFVLPQPQSICHLILKQAWVSVLVLGRWNDFMASLPERLQQLVGPAGSNAPVPSQAELTFSACMDLANHIRRWAEPVLQSQPDPASKESEHMHLEAAVTWLENLSANIPRSDILDVGNDFLLRGCWNKVYSSLFMVKSLLLMRLIPGSIDMKSLLLDAVTLLFPKPLEICLREFVGESSHFSRVLAKTSGPISS